MLAVQLTVAKPAATDVIVTVCVVFAFAGVNVSVAGDTVARAVAEDVQLTVTSALGLLASAKVNVSVCPPAHEDLLVIQMGNKMEQVHHSFKRLKTHDKYPICQVHYRAPNIRGKK